MGKIKISELFYSIQGEGRYMGVPSIFLRTFGCNFTCSGFGMPLGEKTQELVEVIKRVDEFKTYKDLPLVSTGCDSYASWHPSFKHLSDFIQTDDLAEKIVDLLPHKRWDSEHLVITGGEPLLGWQRAYPDLLEHPKMRGLRELTFETNGTQPLTPEFQDYLIKWGSSANRDGYRALTFSISPKLSCSGEDQAIAINPEVVNQYDNTGYSYLKFVVATERDVEEACNAVIKYRAAGFSGPVYLMPVGGVNSVYDMNARNVAEMALKLGFRYSDRLQLPLFKNAWGT